MLVLRHAEIVRFDIDRKPQQEHQPFKGTLKPQNNGLLYSSTIVGTLAVDGWDVTFGTARRGVSGAAARSGPSSLYQM